MDGLWTVEQTDGQADGQTDGQVECVIYSDATAA